MVYFMVFHIFIDENLILYKFLILYGDWLGSRWRPDDRSKVARLVIVGAAEEPIAVGAVICCRPVCPDALDSITRHTARIEIGGVPHAVGGASLPGFAPTVTV